MRKWLLFIEKSQNYVLFTIVPAQNSGKIFQNVINFNKFTMHRKFELFESNKVDLAQMRVKFDYASGPSRVTTKKMKFEARKLKFCT